MVAQRIWNERALKADFIKALYDGFPPFDRIFITEAIFRPHGKELVIKFSIDKLPTNIMSKWGKINSVSITISFFEIISASLSKIDYPGNSAISIFELNDNNIRIVIEGEIGLEFVCEFIAVKGVEGYWRSESI